MISSVSPTIAHISYVIHNKTCWKTAHSRNKTKRMASTEWSEQEHVNQKELFLLQTPLGQYYHKSLCPAATYKLTFRLEMKMWSAVKS